MRLALLVCFAISPLLLPAQLFAEQEFPADQLDFFEKQVRPILVARCISCHGEEEQESGLRLDGRATLLKGGDSGSAVVPGKPEESLLVSAIHYQDYEMPPSGKLPDGEIEVLERWVKLGAPWPKSVDLIRPATFDEQLQLDKAQHWAFQPIADPAPPKVEEAWIKNPIDQFILKRLTDNGLAPSPAADRRTLIRRATYDLTGLPPTPEEVARFASDESPEAYQKLIDRLLASPQYGERWGRHWLDVARYSDTRGYLNNGQDRRFPYAHAYRDYVVDSMNRDTPYNEFIKEQLAADFFAEDGDRRLAGLGLIRIGRQFLKHEDTIDDRIDVVTRGVLGLTVTCAR